MLQALILRAPIQVIFGDRNAALSHFAAVYELVRLKCGVDTFQRIDRRAVIWCEFHVCAAFQLPPTLAPTLPALSNHAANALASAARARGPRHRTPASALDRVLSAFHLVSAATSAAWTPVLMADPACKDAVAAVLDDAAHALLVELARPGARGWIDAVLLHAAHVYLWTALSNLPAGAQLNVMLLERLRGALEIGEGGGGHNGKDVCAALTRCGGGGIEAGGARALLWALVVGWFLAEKIWRKEESGRDGVRRAGAGAKLRGWFEDGIFELLRGSGGGRTKEEAAQMIAGFPATDEFRREWHSLLLQDRFCGWS